MLDSGGAKRPKLIGSVLACVGFALWASKLDDLSLNSHWPYIVMAGAGIGFLLGPSSTDAVNRAINASYGEVTGIPRRSATTARASASPCWGRCSPPDCPTS